jgi:hypothetical protein
MCRCIKRLKQNTTKIQAMKMLSALTLSQAYIANLLTLEFALFCDICESFFFPVIHSVLCL